MLRMRDAANHAPSPQAEENYRNLAIWNRIVIVLFVLIAVAGVWNVVTLADAAGREAPDLADIDHLLRHPSSLTVVALTVITAAVFAFKEWRYGDGGLVMAYPLALLLFLGLVPVMTAETRPHLTELTLELRYLSCTPGSIRDDRHLDGSVCSPVNLPEGSVRMAHANPSNGETTLYAPDEHGNSYSKWVVNGRGVFTVYLMIEQESVHACEARPSRANVAGNYHDDRACLEMDGTAWLVVPMQASKVQQGWAAVYQESAP